MYNKFKYEGYGVDKKVSVTLDSGILRRLRQFGVHNDEEFNSLLKVALSVYENSDDYYKNRER